MPQQGSLRGPLTIPELHAEIHGPVQEFKPIAEAQEAIPKLKAGLAKAQGLSAQAPGPTIEAYAKMAVIGKAAPPQDLESGRRKLRRGQPDNKAGMKHTNSAYLIAKGGGSC